MPPLILAENITKSYGDLQVLKGVDFSLEVREFVA
ncbi:MAG TPA: ABC transporter ATP-binding protein, partial [Cryomorphaceae bacterium]|nr:ABC transporter ATP-binding protein [Cryomorphaceae bacterium]